MGDTSSSRPALVAAHAAVIVGAVALYLVLFPLGERTPSDEPSAGLEADTALAADAGRPDAHQADEIGLLLMRARSAVAPGASDSDLRLLLAAAEIQLDAAAEEALLPLLRQHLEALREHLERAHGMALGDGTHAQRTVVRARAVAEYARFHRTLREHLGDERAVTLLKACPDLVPPPPAGRPAPSEETGR